MDKLNLSLLNLFFGFLFTALIPIYVSSLGVAGLGFFANTSSPFELFP